MNAPGDFRPLFRTSPALDLVGPLYCRGTVHGGILATLADVALGYAMAFASDPPRSLVTANLTLDFAGTAKMGEWLEAHVDVQKQGSRL